MVPFSGVVLVNRARALKSVVERAQFLHVALNVFLAGGFRKLREGFDFLQEVVRANDGVDVQERVVGCGAPVTLALGVKGDGARRNAGERVFVLLGEAVNCEAAKVAVLAVKLLLLLAMEDEFVDVELDAGEVLCVLGVVLDAVEETTDAFCFVSSMFGSLLGGGEEWRKWRRHAAIGFRVDAVGVDEIGNVHVGLLAVLHCWWSFGSSSDEGMHSARGRREVALRAGRRALLLSVQSLQWRQRGRARLRWLLSLLRRLRREARVAGAFPEV